MNSEDPNIDSEVRERLAEYDEEIAYEIERKTKAGIIPDFSQNKDSTVNDNGKTNSNRTLQQQIKQSIPIQNPNPIEFVIKTIQKTVKCEDSLIRHIVYTGLSAYIPDKTTNLGILAPTSEGKTYAVTETLQYFPEEDVEYIGKMSTMALVRQKGILIDKNGQPIDKQVRDLFKRKKMLSDKNEDKEEKIKITEEIQSSWKTLKH